MIILEENFKWHIEAFASELFIHIYILKLTIYSILNIMHFHRFPYPVVCLF